MKIFESDVGEWAHKVNFVDENNVFVGYDMFASCCETADYHIGDEPMRVFPWDAKLNHVLENAEDYRFDLQYCETFTNSSLDSGEAVAFKINNVKTGAVKYITIFNSHNGYYGHGFTFEVNGAMVKEGCL